MKSASFNSNVSSGSTLVLLIAMLIFGPHPAVAQGPDEPTKPDNAGQSDLTQGLLDLLDKPKSDSQADIPLPDVSGPASKNETAGSNPGNAFGTDGEDLGERGENPLETVRAGMLMAADFLGRGSVGADTQQLQGDIVQTLDELIEQLENSDSSQSSPRSSASESGFSKQEQTTQQSQQAASGDEEAQRMNSPQNSNPSNRENSVAAEAIVDLSDPKALQQSVWGHLPERMRTQMQSRMVEQFLPSYREQIEAYFKALLENE